MPLPGCRICLRSAAPIRLASMIRRAVMFLLIALLAGQSAWAAAGAYCRHESGAAAQHFGHHAHAHKSVDKIDRNGGSTSGSHADCSYCHAGFSGATPSVESSPGLAAGATAIPTSVAPPSSHFVEGPERPKWVFAV